MFKNDLILRVLNGQKVDRPPVWMMRQAGRYLPEYMKLREKYSFFERVQTPELACEITLQPVDIIGVDAAILFSDILVVPQAMGLEVQLIEKKGPFLPAPVRRPADLLRIEVPDVQERLHYVFEALTLIKQELNGRVPLIGFAGAPWTLLCYMVQGGGSKTYDEAKALCYTQPELAHRMLQMITDTTIKYLKAQIQAGADLVQLFDSWAGLLSKADFEHLSLPYIEQIVRAVGEDAPIIVFAKGVWYSLNELADTGANALGIDWTLTPAQARGLGAGHTPLQGNLDPTKLLMPIPELKRETIKMLESFKGSPHIANLGHGIIPQIPVDHARAFVDTVKEWHA